jgi:hypothetical protein
MRGISWPAEDLLASQEWLLYGVSLRIGMNTVKEYMGQNFFYKSSPDESHCAIKINAL